MRRVFGLTVIFILIAFSLSASTFGKYDFTFYKTIDDSVAVMNEERFGLDYTGYGFIGSSMTTGIYIRLGVQTPYMTLISLFDRPSDKNENEQPQEGITKPDGSIDKVPPVDPNPPIEIVKPMEKEEIKNPDELSKNPNTISVPDKIVPNTDDAQKPDIDSKPPTSDEIKAHQDREFIFSFTIGPAFRHFISDSVMWYMGLGITSIAKNTTSSDLSSEGTISTVDLKLGTDLDIGFRIDLTKKNTSLRIGAHATTDLLTYTSSTLSGGKLEKPVFSNNLIANIFTPIGEKSATDVTGYIGLGHVFKPKDVVKYRYSNTSTILGGGKLEIIE